MICICDKILARVMAVTPDPWHCLLEFLGCLVVFSQRTTSMYRMWLCSCDGNVISNFVFTTIAANLIKTTVIINSFSSSLWKKELVVQPKDRLQFLFVV